MAVCRASGGIVDVEAATAHRDWQSATLVATAPKQGLLSESEMSSLDSSVDGDGNCGPAGRVNDGGGCGSSVAAAATTRDRRGAASKASCRGRLAGGASGPSLGRLRVSPVVVSCPPLLPPLLQLAKDARGVRGAKSALADLNNSCRQLVGRSLGVSAAIAICMQQRQLSSCTAADAHRWRFERLAIEDDI